MKLRSILIRAYRSFNHDYRKKYDRSAQAEKKPWEMVENQWFPFIEIPIQDQITTIVGANESGKTHLINAVLVALGKTEEFTRLDRCRYLKSSNTKLYENLCIGLHWTLEERDQKPFEYLGIWPESPEALQEFWMFRDTQGYVLYRKNATGEYLKTRLSHELEVQLLALLPEIIELKSSLKLNKIVLLRDLLRYDTLSRIEQLLVGLRKAELLENRFLQRFQNIWKEQSLPDLLKWAIELLNSLKKELPFLLAEMSSSWKAQLQKCLEFLVKDHLLPPLDFEEFFQENVLKNKIEALLQALATIFDSNQEQTRYRSLLFPEKGKLCDLEIEYNLLIKTAQISRSLLYDLCESLDEVTVPNALTQLNESLEKYLQLKSWWVQDEKIKLVVDVKTQENQNFLIFRIKDKSEAVYDMDERSSGLQYFIGYFLQYSCYEKFRQKQCLVFMDEPDRYLSRKGQKALLRIFEELSSSPGENRPPYQVLYTTHSPFLLDRNRLDRLILLEKGPAGEGTRIHTQNLARYEPIRSAIGQGIEDSLSFDYFNILTQEESTRILIEGLLYHYYQHPATGKFLDLNETLIHSSPTWPDLTYTLNQLQSQHNKLMIALLLPHSQKHFKTLFLQQKTITLLPYQLLVFSDIHPQFQEIEDLLPYPLYRQTLETFFLEYYQISLTLPLRAPASLWNYAQSLFKRYHLPPQRSTLLKFFLKLLQQDAFKSLPENATLQKHLRENFLVLNQKCLSAEKENRFDIQDRLTLYNVLFHFRLFRENKEYSEHTTFEDLASSNAFKNHVLELFQEVQWYLQTKSSISRRIEESLEKLKNNYELQRRDLLLSRLAPFYQDFDQLLHLSENFNQLVDQERLHAYHSLEDPPLYTFHPNAFKSPWTLKRGLFLFTLIVLGVFFLVCWQHPEVLFSFLKQLQYLWKTGIAFFF